MKGLFGPATIAFGIVHDDPEITPPDKMRYDAAITVPEAVAPEKDIGIQQLTGGQYAVATHRGPYQTIGDSYARLCGEWLPGSGRELLPAPALELYRNSPQAVPPEELLTDIYMPLAS